MEQTRMTNDALGALGLVGLFLAISASQSRFPHILDSLLMITRPGATILLFGAMWLLYSRGYHITALVAGILTVYLLKTVWITWPRSDARRLHLEVGRDLARFEEANSIDIQFANGSATHNMPHLLQKTSFEELLVFPPSSQTQKDMNG